MLAALGSVVAASTPDASYYIQRRASSQFPLCLLFIILPLTLHTLHHSPLLVLHNQQLKHIS